jgi:hypothetical protein
MRAEVSTLVKVKTVICVTMQFGLVRGCRGTVPEMEQMKMAEMGLTAFDRNSEF